MREFALEAFFKRWQPYLRHQLTASESETTTLADLLHLADQDDLQRWGQLKFGYTDPRGAVWLRESIARLYDHLSVDELLCFTGAQEAIYALMHALLRPSDHAIIVTPNYQSAETVPLAICAATGVALDPARDWALDLDLVAAAIRPNTRLIAINFPNNPTGKIMQAADFEALVALCRHHGIWLFNDEVYRLIERDPARRLPAVVDIYERGISLGSLSKSFGLPGLRMGWLGCRDAALHEKIRHIKTYLSICSDASSEVLSQIAIKAENVILPRNREIAEQNLAMLQQVFAQHRDLFDWVVPDGGVIGFPRYLGPEGSDDFCDSLILDHGVLLMPAKTFHSELTATPRDRFRIGFGRRDFAAGLALLADLLDQRKVGRKRASQL